MDKKEELEKINQETDALIHERLRNSRLQKSQPKTDLKSNSV